MAGFVSGATMRIAEPLIPRVSEEFGVTVAAAAIIVSVFTLAYGVFQIIHGPLGDRFGRLLIVVIALFLAAAASVGCALSGSLGSLATFRFLTGMTTSAVIPMSLGYVADHVPYERRQAVLGRFISGILLGQTFGPLLGGVFIDTIGWRGAFAVLAACYFAMGCVLWPEARDGVRPKKTTIRFFANFPVVLRDRWVRVVLLTVALEGAFFFGALAYVGAFLKVKFSLDYSVIGLLMAGFGIGGVLYSVLVKRLLARLGEKGLVLWGGIFLVMTFAALCVASPWWMLVPVMIAQGFGFYMLHNTLQTKATEMAPENRGTAIASFAFCLFVGQSAGTTLLGGAVDAAGYPPVLLGSGALLCALSVAFRAQLKHSGTPG
jgi:predicted MFS family arabinose efflux permease